LRAGSFNLDNSNFVGGRGGFGRRGSIELPLDDDYTAIRQAIWRATDSQYKTAVETLTQKRAYLKDRTIEDRPSDFTKATVITSINERVTLSLDRKQWEDYVRRVSAKFAEQRHIQDSDVRLTAGVENRYLLNSEGSRLRYAVAEAVLRVTAVAQADDGERLSDQVVYFAPTPAELPAIDKVIDDVQSLSERLAQAVRAPVLKDYTGPVLVDAHAAAKLFRQLLARGIAGQADPVGSPRRGGGGPDDLEKLLGKRILPTTFQIYDDPRPPKFQDTPLAGHYLTDDEGVPAQRVEIVTNGKFQGMLTSRAPTKRFTTSNGHGRRSSGEWPRSLVGSLYIESSDTKSPDELKKALIKAADDEGLEYGLRIGGLRNRDGGETAGRFGRPGGGGRSVGDPFGFTKCMWRMAAKNSCAAVNSARSTSATSSGFSPAGNSFRGR
jgi:predicted Zn-dependent protease